MRQIGRTMRAVLIDCIPRSHWLPFVDMYSAFTAEYGSAWKESVYRQLHRLERAGRICSQMTLDGGARGGQPRKEWRRLK